MQNKLTTQLLHSKIDGNTLMQLVWDELELIDVVAKLHYDSGGIEMTCYNCGYSWTYRGQSKDFVVCPSCRIKVPVKIRVA